MYMPVPNIATGFEKPPPMPRMKTWDWPIVSDSDRLTLAARSEMCCVL